MHTGPTHKTHRNADMAKANKTLKVRLAIAAQICVHLGALLPLIWLGFAIPEGKLGGDPIKELTHFLGMGALRLLILSLCITPLVKPFKLGPFMRLRRPLGLWCFVWASLHFAVWMGLDLAFMWRLIGEELVKRTYIIVGFIAWLFLCALAVTSLPLIMRKMGKYWKRLHRTVYWIALLACLHFYWAVKSGWIEPAIYTGIVLVLLWPRKKNLVP